MIDEHIKKQLEKARDEDLYVVISSNNSKFATQLGRIRTIFGSEIILTGFGNQRLEYRCLLDEISSVMEARFFNIEI